MGILCDLETLHFNKAKLPRLVKMAMEIIGKRENQNLDSSYEQSVLKEVTKILFGPSRCLYSEYELLMLKIQKNNTFYLLFYVICMLF